MCPSHPLGHTELCLFLMTWLCLASVGIGGGTLGISSMVIAKAMEVQLAEEPTMTEPQVNGIWAAPALISRGLWVALDLVGPGLWVTPTLGSSFKCECQTGKLAPLGRAVTVELFIPWVQQSAGQVLVRAV